MRKLLLASFFVILLAPPTALAAESEQPKSPDAFSVLEHASEGTVETVIDPLTVKLRDGRTIHLAGLDYPDYDPYAPGPLCVTAVNILRDFLEGQTVKISRTKNPKAGRMTRMGHEIAHLTRSSDEIWVQGMIVALGMARARTEKDNTEMAQEMYALEQNARAEELGLWAMEAYSIATPESVKAGIGSFQIVEGTVRSVSMKQNRTYLNFGANWQKDFTVTIPPESRRAFAKAGINLLDWNGRTLRVRGWVGFYNGPTIEIDHPQAIELLDTALAQNTQSPEGQTAQETKDTSKKLREKPVFNKGSALPDAPEDKPSRNNGGIN